METEKSKAAIIGCGNIAGGFDRQVPNDWTFTHAGAYHLCSQTQLVGVYDVDRAASQRFRQKWRNVTCYDDLSEMLQNERPQIVSICSPTEKHFECFQAVCSHDVPALFCEKPLSYDLNEARLMSQLAGKRLVAVNYFRRWNLTFQELKERIDLETYGAPLRVTAYYTKGYIHNASHIIDLLIWFFGPVIEIRLLRIWWKEGEDAGIDFCLEFENGPLAHIFHLKDAVYNIFEIDLLFEKGRALLSQRGQEISAFDVLEEPHYQQFLILKEKERQQTSWKHCMLNAVEDMVSCLKYGGKPRCSIEEGIQTLEVCASLQSQFQ